MFGQKISLAKWDEIYDVHPLMEFIYVEEAIW